VVVVADIDSYFNGLGRAVNDRWGVAGRSHENLPDIATVALAEHPVPDQLDAPAVLAHLATNFDLPTQRPLTDLFGQPPAMFYRRHGLEIQALTWMEGTTSIHQHGFDGAFRVLCGSSLHVQYTFDPAESLADGHLTVGALQMQSSEVLRAGDTRPIVSGPGFIHALFHLERPSVTIVVRNKWSDLPFPQYDYRRPGLGIDALFRDDELAVRLRALHSLHRLDPDDALRVARDMVRTQDLWTAYRVTDHWFYNFGASDRFAALVETLGARHRALAELVGPMYTEEGRSNRLLARRSMLTELRHRMFLALLANLPEPAAVFHVMGQLFPDEDPVTVILALVEELASPQYRGISGLRLGADDLDRLRARLALGADDPLRLVAEHWQPPALLDRLLV
jgi:hypothetical protein